MLALSRCESPEGWWFIAKSALKFVLSDLSCSFSSSSSRILSSRSSGTFMRSLHYSSVFICCYAYRSISFFLASSSSSSFIRLSCISTGCGFRSDIICGFRSDIISAVCMLSPFSQLKKVCADSLFYSDILNI